MRVIVGSSAVPASIGHIPENTDPEVWRHRLLRQKDFPEAFGSERTFLVPSCCVVGGGGAPLEIVRSYLEAQADPSRRRTGAIRRDGAKRKKKKKTAGREEALTST